MKRRPTHLDETRLAHIREDRDLESELDAHLAHRVDDLVAAGLSPERARERARRELGDPARIKAESRAARDSARQPSRGRRLDGFRQDLRHTLRQLLRSPGFALTALATLTLGVGATTTIVSVVNAVVLEPLPFREPDRVVVPRMLTPEGSWFSVSEPTFLDWREQVQSFQGVAAIGGGSATQRGPGEPRSIEVAHVTHDLLDVLGLAPALGRMFSRDEDRAGEEAAVAVLSHDAWHGANGADPDVLGTTVDLNGRAFRIVGVMPDGLDLFTGPAPLLLPLGPNPTADRGEHYLDVVARLADGRTLESALADLVAVQQRIADTHQADVDWSATIQRSRDVLVGGDTIAAGWILLAAAGLLLAMACVNVSNLLMVRATARRAEMGVRAALGASRTRLARQLFTESALLTALGGAGGVLLARGLLPIVRALGEARIPRLEDAALDGTALLACLAAVAGASVVCGLAPVAQLRPGALAGSIGSGGRGGSEPGTRLRSLLVGAQVCMTVVLLVGNGLLLRSFIELSNVDPGFEPEGTLAVGIRMPDPDFTWANRGEVFAAMRQAVEALPGVAAAGATAVDPFSGGSLANFVARADRMPDRASAFTPIAWRAVTPGFFEAMGMELRAGRAFLESDDWGEETPIVIGERLARILWDEGESPIGQTVVWGDPTGSRLLVVGVVEDLRDLSLAEEPPPIVYRPHRQIPWPAMTLVVRVNGEPAAVAASLSTRIREVVPGLPVPDIHPLEQNLARAVAEPRFNLQLMSSFAVAGLVLAVVGIYGLTAFDVRRRFREIGIRLSLGAEPDDIPVMILKGRMRSTALGVLAGLAVAWPLTRWIESQLYGIGAKDPLTWTSVVAVVILASAAAAWVPALRAARVDPTQVLGTE